jgi:hypothetical protein
MCLSKIQTQINAPKKQYNSFGEYYYRSCEDILEGLKPFLAEHGATIVLNDEIVQIGDRYYVKATATLKSDSGEWTNTAYAREPESRKKMDEAQITGATSSYARKYALQGLLALDDQKDPDSQDNRKSTPSRKPDSKPKPEPKSKAAPKSESKPEKPKKVLGNLSKGTADAIANMMTEVGVAKPHLLNHLKKHYDREYIKDEAEASTVMDWILAQGEK